METNLISLLPAILPLLIAGILYGITGFGLLLIATPLLFQLFPPKTVIAALIIPTLVSNVAILWRDRVSWEQLNLYTGLYISGAVGTLVGVVGLVVLDRQAIFLIVAGYIVVFLALTNKSSIAHEVASLRGISVIAGGSGGLLGGTIGLSGPPVVTYLHAKKLDKSYFVGLLAAFFLITSLIRVPSMYVTNLFGVPEFILGVAFTIPAVIGTYLGAVVRHRIPRRPFQAGVEVLLLLVAINLVFDVLSVQIL